MKRSIAAIAVACLVLSSSLGFVLMQDSEVEGAQDSKTGVMIEDAKAWADNLGIGSVFIMSYDPGKITVNVDSDHFIGLDLDEGRLSGMLTAIREYLRNSGNAPDNLSIMVNEKSYQIVSERIMDIDGTCDFVLDFFKGFFGRIASLEDDGIYCAGTVTADFSGTTEVSGMEVKVSGAALSKVKEFASVLAGHIGLSGDLRNGVRIWIEAPDALMTYLLGSTGHNTQDELKEHFEEMTVGEILDQFASRFGDGNLNELFGSHSAEVSAALAWIVNISPSIFKVLEKADVSFGAVPILVDDVQSALAGVPNGSDNFKYLVGSISCLLTDEAKALKMKDLYSSGGSYAINVSVSIDLTNLVGSEKVKTFNMTFAAGIFKGFQDGTAIEHKVSFNANGGTGSMNDVSAFGEYILPKCSFEAPQGLEFAGWAYTPACDPTMVITGKLIVETDVELYAVWITIPEVDDRGNVILSPETWEADNEIHDALSNGQRHVIGGDVSHIGDAKSVTVAADYLQYLSGSLENEDSISHVQFATSSGAVMIHKDSLSGLLADAQNVTVRICDGKAELNPSQIEAAGGMQVYSIDIFADENAVGQFGQPLHIRLGHTLPSDKSADDMVVWHLRDDGTKEKLECSYDSETKVVSFAISHLSSFAVGYDGISPVSDGNDDNGSTVYVAAAIIIVTVLLMAAIIYYRR